MKQNDGGPAFPVSTQPCVDEGGYGHQSGDAMWQFPGLTIRDYFAAKALPVAYQGYVEYANDHGWDEGWRIGLAMDAYALADAMLAAREVRHD